MVQNIKNEFLKNLSTKKKSKKFNYKNNKTLIKKKICFPFVGDSIGGSHISSLLLINELKKNYRIKIILHEKNVLSKFLEKKGIKYEIFRLSKFPKKGPYFIKVLLFLFLNFFKLNNYLRKNNFDIIHGNDLRVNLCWSFANMNTNKFIWHQRNILNKKSLLHFFILFFSDHVIAISKTVYNCFPGFIKKKTSVVYNPFKKIRIKAHSKKISNIAFVGKDNYQKGFDIFLKIFFELKKNTNIQFNAYCSKFLSNYDYKNFNIYSFKTIESIMSKNDLLIAPSRKEGFGRSLIEFAIQKKKVIASNIDAHREINSKFVNIILVKNEAKEYLKVIKKNLIPSSKIISKNLKKLDPKFHVNSILQIYRKF